MNTNTGSYIALAGIVVTALQYFGIVVDQNAVVTLLAAGAIIYGWIHQYVITRKVAGMAKAAGVKGIK